MDTQTPAQPPDETPPEPIEPETVPPIRRREPVFRIPPVTFWLIAVNVLVHLVLQTLSPEQQDAVVNTLGFDPATLRQPVTAIGLLSLVTYQFLHGGWEHLGFNMITLLAFGSGVERAIGRLRYLVLYEVAGIAGALLQGVLTRNGDGGVMIGASASISGLFGAFLSLSTLHTRGRGAIGIVPMALLWIGMLALTGILGVGAQGMPVAWIAHIGGFLAGLAYGFALRAGRERR